MIPRVSVVIPVFNHERFIKECVDSVLEQDYPGLEVVVVDDGSTDNTPSILRGYGKRLRVLRQPNSGAARALNRGLQVAQGDWIGWLSSDDVYAPGKIAAQLSAATHRSNAQVLYTDWIMIDDQGRELSRHLSEQLEHPYAIWRLLQGNFINGSSVLFRRDVIATNAFDEGNRLDSDGEMWFRLLKAGVEFLRTPGFFLRYRWHEQNMSHKRALLRRGMDTTRISAVRTATDNQLFPFDAANCAEINCHILIRALIRQECYGAAALVIERAAATRRIGRKLRWLAPLLSIMSSPRCEPLVALNRLKSRAWRLIK